MVGAEPMLKISWMLRAVDFEVRYTVKIVLFFLFLGNKRNGSPFFIFYFLLSFIMETFYCVVGNYLRKWAERC
jgi:hypothetical protein